MKKIVIGVLIGFALASTIVMAEQATEQRGMGGIMQGMGDQKSGEAPSMQGMQQMMGMMMKMMERRNAMMGGMMGHKGGENAPTEPEKK